MATNRSGDRDAEIPMTLLERWKRHAAVRRERLRTALFSRTTAPGQGAFRQDWIERTLANVIARRRWSEARLEHLRALESLLRESTTKSQD